MHHNKEYYQNQHGFLILLIAIIALNLVPAFFEQANHAFFVRTSSSTVLCAALYLVANKRKQLIVGFVLGAPAIVSRWWTPLSDPYGSYLSHVLIILFLGYVIVHLFKALFRSKQISTDTIYAAICIFFLIALEWSFIYMAILQSNPLAFNLPNGALTSRQVFADMLYYSYVTITTLGYGEITPVSRLARSCASLEAIMGQFYIAIIVARLVALSLLEKSDTSP